MFYFTFNLNLCCATILLYIHNGRGEKEEASQPVLPKLYNDLYKYLLITYRLNFKTFNFNF